MFFIYDEGHLCLFSRQLLVIIMVFSSEDRILIEQLHRIKGYGARKLVKEFPEKGWKVCSLGLYYDRTDDDPNKRMNSPAERWLFWHSPGTVATVCGWGGQTYNLLVSSSFMIQCAKNGQNRFIFEKKNKNVSIFWGHIVESLIDGIISERLLSFIVFHLSTHLRENLNRLLRNIRMGFFLPDDWMSFQWVQLHVWDYWW